MHLEGCKNHKVPHLHPNSTVFMPLDRLQLKIYAFSGKFNVCSKRVLLSWIKIYCNFTPQTQIFTEIQELTQILLRISEEKIGGWSLWSEPWWLRTEKISPIYVSNFAICIVMNIRKITRLLDSLSLYCIQRGRQF